MSVLVIALRTVSVVAFAGPMLLVGSGRHGERDTRARPESGGRASVVANFSAFGLFFPSVLIFSGSADASLALPMALEAPLALIARVRLRSGRIERVEQDA